MKLYFVHEKFTTLEPPPFKQFVTLLAYEKKEKLEIWRSVLRKAAETDSVRKQRHHLVQHLAQHLACVPRV